MPPFGRTSQQQMPHRHLEGRPIEVPLGEARHSEKLKLLPIALFNKFVLACITDVLVSFSAVWPITECAISWPRTTYIEIFHGWESPTYKIFHGWESPTYKIFRGWESSLKSLSQKLFFFSPQAGRHFYRGRAFRWTQRCSRLEAQMRFWSAGRIWYFRRQYHLLVCFF